MEYSAYILPTSMQIIPDIPSFRSIRQAISPQLRIGFVPTMGALHEGHASLVRQSVLENDITIVSIFVNPTQFGPNEDLDKYPRNLEADAALLESLGVDFVFTPSAKEVYPDPPAQFYFEIRDLDKKLCGASRPGHMNGVVQVVSILFNIVQPNFAYFGLKDYQQCLILQTLVRELHFPLTIVPCPIVRESDGLAMSSRNVYLSPSEREQALFLSKVLAEIKAKKASLKDVAAAKALVTERLQSYPLAKLDYFEIYDGRNLKEIPSLEELHQPHAFIAAYLGTTRLIDNLAL
ncbi:MAG: pantoate--beta-alanine ligase [Bacteroidota bacterium]